MQPPYPPDSPNRAIQPQPPPPQQPVRAVAQVADKGAERTLAVAAHAAIGFGFFGVGFLLSLVITGVIWLYSKRSPEVRFHSDQAGCYQCSVLLINVVAVIILALLGGFSVFAGVRGENDWGVSWAFFPLLTLFVIWFFGTILYGLFAAVMVMLGKRFKYPIIGNRFDRR